MAFGAITDLWLIVILSRSRDDYHYMPVATMPLAQALICSAVTAVGLFSFAAALNDLLDAKHDRIFSPHRPIASGDIGAVQAFFVAIASLLLALVGVLSFGFGALFIALLIAGGTLFYNGTAKYIPGVGLLTIGLLHAGHMLIPNDQFTFTLPAWLAMTHATAVATIMHFVQAKRQDFPAEPSGCWSSAGSFAVSSLLALESCNQEMASGQSRHRGTARSFLRLLFLHSSQLSYVK